MRERTFSPGFRLSIVDIVVLVLGTIGAITLLFFLPWLAFVIAFVVGHFFLFCNVLRMARPLELVWAAVFVLLAGATVTFDLPGWWITAAMSLATTVLVAIVQMRRPSYHGVGWQRINPGLREWWESRSTNIASR